MQKVRWLVWGQAALFTLVFYSFIGHSTAQAKSSAECPLLLTPHVSADWVEQMKIKGRAENPQVERLRQTVQRVGFDHVAINNDILKNHSDSYTLTLPRGYISNQYGSGRCWIFAALNMIRSIAMRQNHMIDVSFRFSHNYIWFFNFIEQINHYAEEVIKMRNHELSPKTLRELLAFEPQQGGYFEYFAYLADKYGLVPYEMMPDTAQSLNPEPMINELVYEISLFEGEMKKMYEKDTAPSAEVLRKRKATMMEHIWKILATHLGDPPQKFSYRHRVSREADIDHKIGVSQQEAGVVLDWTPQTFAKKFAGFNANDWITISAYPGLDKNKFYRVRDEEIAKTGPGETRFRRDLINVTPTELEGYVQSSITHQVPLWSAIEVLRDVDHDTGIMHPDLYERSPIYGPNFGRDDDASNKLLSYSGYSQPRHAVLINGMDWPQNAKHAIKYRVENSWGYFNGDGGEYHMYREWLLKYVYEVTVHISLLKPEQGDLLKSNPTSIDPHLVF